LASPGIAISEGAKFNIKFDAKEFSLLPNEIELKGRRLQVAVEKHRDDRELTLGLDFGTSCTKVIIGDAAAGKSFAVPFVEAAGIDRYLMASRVYETNGRYSLLGGSVAHRDLKLSFIDGKGGINGKRRVVAYLALVIRRARGWLIREYYDIYRDTRIFWRLAIGLPSRQNFDTHLYEQFKLLALASWRVAGIEGDVNQEAIDQALVSVDKNRANPEDVEIRVIPEIAAQIYGFVVSDSFDRMGDNIFLIADVGSGTIDASLFFVNKDRKHNFSFYKSTVEPNGVINLHRHRAQWWRSTLRSAGADHHLVNDLENSLASTDHCFRIPENYRDYFDGIHVDSSESGLLDPDYEFFRKVKNQVVTETFYGAVKDNQVRAHQLVRIPFYLCGGGSRMKYYGNLERELNKDIRSFGISANLTPLTTPENLEVAGIANNYDRLSVAYGLGWLDPGWVIETEPMPRIESTKDEWRDNYVDKDQM
jgi:hypothetical protein